MQILTDHQKAALDFDRHISLTANAGSGKTFVLSKRYLEIALSQKYPNLRSIAAISFTDKAAGELYKKIVDEIEERLSSEKEPDVIIKLNNIRRQLVSANISTIHSFCINILREFPVEAGLDANFTPIDEQISDELIELSVDEVIKFSFNEKDDEDKFKYLVRVLGSKSIFTKELIMLIKKRKNVLAIIENIYNNSLEEIASHFGDQFLLLIKELFSEKINTIIEIINDINSEVSNKKPENEIAAEIALLLKETLIKHDLIGKIILLKRIGDRILTKSKTIRKKGYLSGDYEAFHAAEIRNVEMFYSDLINIEIPGNYKIIELELARFGKTLIHFFNKAVDIYNSKKKENAYLDYEDILLLVQELLVNPSVKEFLSKKFQYIMIDEYQDTNEIQYNIFLPILDHLKEGNLFVVGDEKQSIYMFRDAELEVFNRTKKDIERTRGENKLLTLPESFRMAPGIALFVNELFGKLFENPELKFNEVAYNELITASNVKSEGSIELLIATRQASINLENDETNGCENVENELIARRIRKLVNDGDADYGNIAILCRRRKEFKELENTFAKNNIPFIVVGGKGFYQRQPIFDLYNYFSFLLNIDNDTALVGTLRSPFFNLSDSVIYEVSVETGKNYWEKFKKYARSNTNYKGYIEILSENIQLSSSYDVTSLLRKMLDESAFLAVVASGLNSEQELANIRKVVNITTNFDSKGFKTLYDYVSYLKESINQLEDEAQANITKESDSVQIMTYHQAKGLEFKAVFLHKADEGMKKDTIKAKRITINKHFGLLTKVPINNNFAGDYQKAPIIGISDLIEERKSSAEFKRLFYVGVTRAKEYLFICGTEKKDYAFDINSIFGMISSALGLDYNSDTFSIKSKLKFVELIGNKFITKEKSIGTKIRIIKEIDISDINTNKAENIAPAVKLNARIIKDRPEGEFISATKIAVYNQCPLKYQLTYEYGFTKLFSRYKSWFTENGKMKSANSKYEFNIAEIASDEKYSADEKGKNNYADIKGRIIHKILQKEIEESSLELFISENIKNELDVFDYSKNDSEFLKMDIINDIKAFYKSTIFNKLQSFKNYKNEFEIYINENDYFLYGIIDKLIIEENKFTIIDYKTDDIAREEIKERGQAYLPQLEFYSYIVHRFFGKNFEIGLKLIFLKHSNNILSKTVNSEDFVQISQDITEMVASIRSGKYSKNLGHCKSCLYALNQKQCIIEN